MRFQRLDDWLAWQETLHPKAIDLGLERVHRVARTLDLLKPVCPVLTVAGTNGKGSAVAYAEAIWRAAGYRTGCYTSPHLLHYSERVRIDGQPVDDRSLVEAFDAVDCARGGDTLSYFEFGTLAALWLFRRAALDALVLEVGLGGRLDAVNVVDASVALVTSIGLDHADWLGTDLQQIGREKAGIFREGRPAVYAADDMPESIDETAASVGAVLYRPGAGFHCQRHPDGSWDYRDAIQDLPGLPPPGLTGAVQYGNAAGVLCALGLLSDRLPVTPAAVRGGIGATRLAGRMQHLPGAVDWLLDVAHNADSAATLASNLTLAPCAGRRMALFALMARKELASVVDPLRACFDGWYLLDLPDDDARSAVEVADYLGKEAVMDTGSVDQLLPRLDAALRPGDQLVVFGSFRTVEEALRYRSRSVAA
ncbi:MAG: bifunctional tetrahydrofolate synthase/dihydrofolate synthase [Ectothiorhodospiraceae bacterium]|nr:bifunctional tetrahydrofolate synthase/dihydrofolate synthase [Ectothiorhodospiraceae bacterium]